MEEHALRLGDLIDDYCPRCRLLLNHAVASQVGEQVAKVICQTCFTEHPFLHGKVPAKKAAGSGRMTLFDQVLANMPGPSADPPGSEKKKKAASKTRYRHRHSAKSRSRKK